MSLYKHLRRLHRDTEGATMVMGTWMALGLIGATWYMIGIGDALIYREHMQEAADSVAFSAAVVQARGMNFISAINLIMMVLVVVFLLIRIFEDFLNKILTLVVGFPQPKCWVENAGDCCAVGDNPIAVGFDALVGGTGCAISQVTNDVYKTTKDIRKGYENNILAPGALPVLGKVEKATQLITPAAAFASGVAAGQIGYGEWGFPLSLSMVPGALPRAVPIPRTGGLPLEERRFGDMCSKVSKSVIRWSEDKVLSTVPPLKDLLQKKPLSLVVDVINNYASLEIQEAYCPFDENPWAKEGFLVTPTLECHNGDPVYQLWSFMPNKTPEDKTHANRIVTMGTYLNPSAPPAPKDNTYVAQSEYYFDCADAWTASSCNGGFLEWNTSFSLKWKARLKRVSKPNVLAVALDEFGEFLQTKIASLAGSTGTPASLVDYSKDQAIRYLFSTGETQIQDGINSQIPQGPPNKFVH